MAKTKKSIGTKKVAKPKKKAAAKKSKPAASVKKPAAKKTPAEKPAANKQLDALRADVQEAEKEIKDAQAKAKELREEADAMIKYTKIRYSQVLKPYKEACKKAGVECEFSGGRGASVSERVRFLVEKVDDGVKVTIKDRPETVEIISFDMLKESINKAAYSYTERHLGTREEIGNKGGGLSNRLRKVIGMKKDAENETGK